MVAVSEPRGGGGRRFLSVNGKTDAGSGSEDVVTQKLIAHVPMLLHTGPRRVLVIGWGAGATAASVALHPVASLECVEIEKATWEAASFFSELSGRLARDPRFRIVFADGRNHLLRDVVGVRRDRVRALEPRGSRASRTSSRASSTRSRARRSRPPGSSASGSTTTTSIRPT